MNRKVLSSAGWLGTLVASGLLAVGTAQAAETKATGDKATGDKAAESGPSIRVSGIFKPEMTYSNGVETFGKLTLVAPTAASHPLVDPLNDEFRQSFQLQQSRFSLHVGEGSRAEGHVEVDFVDPAFAKSSPIQGASPRLRTAYVKFKIQPGHNLTVGQAWDIFSPLNPSMMNMVAVSYQSGNSAFLRPQVIYDYTGGPWEVAAAVGMQRQNTGPSVNNVEYALTPSFALRVSHRVGKAWYGFSAIGSSQVTQAPPSAQFASTYALNVFAAMPVSPSLSLKIEAYGGQNTGALGLLTLGSGTDIKDAGGFVSAAYKMDAKNQIWLLGSGAYVLNPEDVAVGYTETGLDTPPSRRGISGIESNYQVRATYVHTPTKGLEMYIEPFLYLTRHKLLQADDPSDSEADRTGYGTAIGTRYRF